MSDCRSISGEACYGSKMRRGDTRKGLTSAAEWHINATMNISLRHFLPILPLGFAFALGLPNQLTAEELKEAKVTQVVQDVKLLPSNASPRPATINDNVRHGTAVQTGTQSRSELTFKD